MTKKGKIVLLSVIPRPIKNRSMQEIMEQDRKADQDLLERFKKFGIDNLNGNKN